MRVFITFCQIGVLFSLALTVSSQTSTSSMQSTPIGIGDIAPGFTLEDQNHNKVSLADARGKSPVVLVFYRGYW